MALIACSSFFINDIRQFGPFSAIHLLSLWTLMWLPIAVGHARRGRIAEHRKVMISLFVGALLITGALTFYPGRIMHQVAVGARPM
jgi:uncharacterized membrane protein